MPELPEVETTAKDLNKLIKGLEIIDLWNGYNSSYFKNKPQVKDPKYFKKFKKEVLGAKVKSVNRRAKNVLIHLDNGWTILIHMKMTGHLLYGKYEYKKGAWKTLEKGPLEDPFNQFIRFVFCLSNRKHLVLSDVRKFAKITLIETDKMQESKDLGDLGPEPLEKSFDFKKFKERLGKRPTGRIKNVLMDPTIIAGVGNIYSDETLWMSKIHPEILVKDLNDSDLKKIYQNMLKVLNLGISFKGDSTSDYRNPSGLPGNFQHHHKVYRKKGQKCARPKCQGKICRRVVGGRSAHFCNICQGE